MDQVTFHHDTVLSEIHLLLPNTRHLMTRLNQVGQPVFISRFKILWHGENQDESDSVALPGGEELGGNTRADGGEELDGDTRADGGGDTEPPDPVQPVIDEDGDLEVTRRPRDSEPAKGRDPVYPIILSQAAAEEEEEEEEEEEDQCSRDVIRIEHTMATPLEDVGKQVWRGAFLLADFILSQPATFRGATVLELGAGTGLTSVVMATVAKLVYCTDIGVDLLSMCQRNMASNKHLLEPTGGDVRVRELDWLRHDLCTDPDAEFAWTEDEVADLYDNTTFIIAADVCYDDDLTDALFQTLYKVCSNLQKACTVYLSIEKRLNFTLRHMDVSCEAYNHFRHCLSELRDLKDGRTGFRVERVVQSFPQLMQYERIEQLELWKVIATPLLTSSTGT